MTAILTVGSIRITEAIKRPSIYNFYKFQFKRTNGQGRKTCFYTPTNKKYTLEKTEEAITYERSLDIGTTQYWAEDTDRRRTKQKPQQRKLK